ncbi:MAG: polynucleotide kinase-phosphatase [Bacteroidota bacterium]
MKIELPEYCLVILIGAHGVGKSQFAERFFSPTEVLSLNQFRSMVGDQSPSEAADADAHEALSYVLEKRLKNNCLTVIDAVNARQSDRQRYRRLAKKYYAELVAVVLDLPESVLRERLTSASPQTRTAAELRKQVADLQKNIGRLKSEGIRRVHHLRSVAEIDALQITRRRMHSNFRTETGPFDIIGDVHGCREELIELLKKLGYTVAPGGIQMGIYDEVTPPSGRKALFVGDIVDRGPDSPGALKLVMSMVRAGVGLWAPGNHDDKLCRKLQGRNVKLQHGLAETMQQMENEPPRFHEEVRDFIRELPTHLVLDEGRLVVAHAGIKEHMQGRETGGIKSFCLYGETTGETDEFGLPIRYNWAENYRGAATIVYGHTPIPRPEWLNRTVNIDTGCVFGGKMTALRYPEKQFVSVDARREYSPPRRPLPANVPTVNTQQKHDEVLDFTLFRDRSLAVTRMLFNITPKDWQVTGAIEYMNRYAVHPKWLIYLPSTLSAPKASAVGALLEHPAQAFDYYKKKGLPSVVVQEMPGAKRVVVIIGRNEKAIQERFGLEGEGIGVVYTDTGRPYFSEERAEQDFLENIRRAIEKAGWWEQLNTNWLCLEANLSPAGEYFAPLLKGHYAALASTGLHAQYRAREVLERATQRGLPVAHLREKISSHTAQLEDFQEQVAAQFTGEFRMTPVHLLAAEGRTFTDQPHPWHVALAQELALGAPELIQAPVSYTVELDDEDAIREATAAWERYVGAGGAGMVVKPMAFIPDPSKDIVQPGLKVRGPGALRLIFGPHFDAAEQLANLRKRKLKLRRELSIREFALSYEALHRFVEGAPLSEVHQCVFIHLSIKANVLDPRL